MYKISTPVPEFNGKVAGVWFANGEAETDSEGAIAYFRRHGYDVEPVEAEPKDEPKAKPTPAKPAPKG